jgi:ankyrin repeat protein
MAADGSGGSHSLHLAAADGNDGNEVTVQQLLVAGAVPSVTLDGCQPLHGAAAGGQGPVVRQLLAAGPNVAAVTSKGSQALHLAATRGHTEVVRQLLGAGANVAAVESQKGRDGVVQLLLAVGPSLAAQDSVDIRRCTMRPKTDTRGWWGSCWLPGQMWQQ